MSETPQSSNHNPSILFGVGVLSIFFGLVLLVERLTVASLVFGKDFPVTSLDELKILFVDCGAVFVIAQGVLLLLVGLFLVARSGGGREVAAGPVSR